MESESTSGFLAVGRKFHLRLRAARQGRQFPVRMLRASRLLLGDWVVLGDSQTSLWFLGGCGELLRSLSMLFSAPRADGNLGTEALCPCRPAPATLLPLRPCATQPWLLSFLVYNSLATLLI